ncbi:Uncharacterized protein PCOAH_00023310 [Plasmodium coatneyi]|uniref:Pv-fam-d protein n=1 Tax=Plasmodium coatneyi TaxID=208452 RepID=A0A1B1DYR9_9APIC|nr:Uncharacterized protein PCOAH_00023310 [Plasmodium coatneyi]ANQ07951.1 Uncharacterized protein PCOAH_00023310 [Plasmodium coatneyi]
MLNIVIRYLLLLIISIWTLDRSEVVDCTYDSVWEKKFNVQEKSNASRNRLLTENEEMQDKVKDGSCSNSSSKSLRSNNHSNRQNTRRSSNSHVGDTRYSPATDNYNYLVPEGYMHDSNQKTDNSSRNKDVNDTSREKHKSQNAESSNGRKIDNPYRAHFEESLRKSFEELPYEYLEGPSDQHFERTNLQDVDYDQIKPFSSSHGNYEDIRYASIDDDDDVSEGSTSEEDDFPNYSFNHSMSSRPRNPYHYKAKSRRHRLYETDDYSVYDDTYDTHSAGDSESVISDHGNNALGHHDGKEEDLSFLDQHYRLPLKKSNNANGDGEYVVNVKDDINKEIYDLTVKPHNKKASRVNKRIKRYIKKCDGKVVKQLPFLSTAFFIGGIVFSCYNYVVIPIICSTLSFIFTSYYIKRLKMKRRKQKRIKREYLMKL